MASPSAASDSKPAGPAEVRAGLVRALRLDLVGPSPQDAEYQEEVLPRAPRLWYLAGFLVPAETEGWQRGGDTADEKVDELGHAVPADDDAEPEPVSARRGWFPSSLGLSVLVAPGVGALEATVCWGDYLPETGDGRQEGEPASGQGSDVATMPGGGGRPPSERDTDEGARSAPPDRSQLPRRWLRRPRRATVAVVVPLCSAPVDQEIEGSQGLHLVTTARPVHGLPVPAGTRSVSVFVVNRRPPMPDLVRDVAYAFQVELVVRCPRPFVARPDPRGLGSDDEDERIADLQYRDAAEHAVGHNVSAVADLGPDGECRSARTAWVPVAEVERVVPARDIDVELRMEVLAGLDTADAAREALGGLPRRYGEWLASQAHGFLADARRTEMASELLRRAEIARGRIADGIDLLERPDVMQAFRLANRAMAMAARRREAQKGTPAARVDPPSWFPFQLAFLLMNLRGLAEPLHADRELVDLLFFPTGGGKTEAYLGIAAFAMVLRRLRNPGAAGSGTSVLMRYTLRLLTLDQLGRAAALVCALELLREQDVAALGSWPFEIGLWVGQKATPNRMGGKGDPDDQCAYHRTRRFQADPRRHPAPIPLENCPWCGERFTRDSFQLVPTFERPTDLRVTCASRRCDFGASRPLPILAVDEPIHRRLPAFLIATVDKFAALPWTGHTGALFGLVERHDEEGFYGPMDPGCGRPLTGSLPPPDLVIQDELHLISGPLGTMVGLYETAIDRLCERREGDRAVRPKVVASTATVRRAARQVQAIFGRSGVEVFPPPGPDRRDSFFAHAIPCAESPGRLYVGVAAQGQSLKVAMLRTYLALLGAGQRAWEAAPGSRAEANPADAYMTLVGYFGALRELGGSRRIVEDEVNSRLSVQGARRRIGEAAGLFSDRRIRELPVELTSRVGTHDVAEAKRRLALPFRDRDGVDVALATNMISVGLDISRLGLMVVNGQPKTAAEYIQATSRVGRDPSRPGLVVVLLNVHRPRDRSHYERFAHWHATFHRAVEATSVTPFAARAVERGLAAVCVALARLGDREMTGPQRAIEIQGRPGSLGWVADALGRRAEAHDARLDAAEALDLRQAIRRQAADLLDAWERLAREQERVGAGLYYGGERGRGQALLHVSTDPDLPRLPRVFRSFRAARSLRDVEPAVALLVRNPDGAAEEGEET